MALESGLLVDGGKTVVFQGLRVTADLRGHGIGGALQKHVCDYIRRHHPEVSTVRRSRGDQLSPQILTKYRLMAKEVSFLVTKPESLIVFIQWFSPKPITCIVINSTLLTCMLAHYYTFHKNNVKPVVRICFVSPL